MSALETAREAIAARREALIALSHFVHAHPELGYEEFESSAAAANALEAAGFTVERGSAGLTTAFKATVGSGPLHLVYCAEFDALPDVGHACGHNIICASSVGAGIGLAAVADELGLTVTVLGTPSEEGGGGKIDLINAGYFADVHAAMMIHPWPGDGTPGVYSDRLAGACLAVDQFDVIFTGKEAHASAAPWEGINALDALTISQVAIGLLRQQLPAGDQVHLIVADGGVAANIIPSHIVARVMVRSTTIDRLAILRERINRCFEAGAMATGATVTMELIGHTFSHMETDPGLITHYRTAAEALGRSFALDDAGAPIPTFSTDMANVSLVVPTIHPLLGIPAHGAVNHQPEFTAACITDAADEAMLEGALALAQTGVLVARDEALRARLLSRS
jgi:amidohydrolase